MTERRSGPGRVLASLLTVCLLLMTAGCVTRSEEGETRWIATLGDPEHSGLGTWPGRFQSPMTDFDIDGNGVKEIIAHSSDGNVYVFAPFSGRALAKITTTYPPAWYIDQVSNGVAVAPLAPGAPPTVVIANHAGYVSAWTFHGDKSKAGSFVFERQWEVRLTDCVRSPSMDGGATLGDLDGDGTLDILVQNEEQGLYALKADGSTLWHHCWGGGNGAPVAADLDQDGDLEAVFASDAGFISVFDGKDGEPLWTFNAADPTYGIKPASVPVSPTVADLDGKPPLEVLFVARHAPADDPERFSEFHMAIFAVRQNTSTWQTEVVFLVQPEWANPMSYARLVVHDIDGDKKAEIFGMDWNTIGHRPGAWDRLGPGNVFRLSATGETVWVREIDAWWSNKDIALGDTDGDGELDLLVNGPKDGVDGLWRITAEHGRTRGFIGMEGWKLLGGPRLLDLRGDGDMQLAFRATPEPEVEGRGAILVHDLDRPYMAPAGGGVG